MKLKQLILGGLTSVVALTLLPVSGINAKSKRPVRQFKTLRTVRVDQVSHNRVVGHLNLRRGTVITLSKYNRRLKGYSINGQKLKRRRGILNLVKRHRLNWCRLFHKKLRRRNVKRVRQINRKLRRKQTGKKRNKILDSKFKRSNNVQQLKRSGFFDAEPFGGNFIFSKYAPNDHRAVIPKNIDITHLGWVKGHFGQPNPPAYAYNAKQKGWFEVNAKSGNRQ